MSKLIFNMDAINKEVIPSINNTIEKLDSAVNKGSQLYIPSDFQYASTLRQILSDNNSAIKELIQLRDKINSDNKLLNDSMTEVENSCYSIKNLEIPKRESSIKTY